MRIPYRGPRSLVSGSAVAAAPGPRGAATATGRSACVRGRPPSRGVLGVVAACLLACGLAGCEREMRNMYDQPRLDPGESSPLFPDGRGSRPPPPGSVPHTAGQAAAESSGARGADVLAARADAEAASAPPPVTRTLLHRGQERYGIYCTPCHSPVGDGDGMIVRRGFPAPPTFHQDRLREAADRHLYDVIAAGYGVMPPFADRLTPADRWAVVAYVRALQFSRHAPVARLTTEQQARLAALPTAAAAPMPSPGAEPVAASSASAPPTSSSPTSLVAATPFEAVATGGPGAPSARGAAPTANSSPGPLRGVAPAGTASIDGGAD